MKDILCPHLLIKFQPKILKSPVTDTCPKFVCCPKMHSGSLVEHGFKRFSESQTFGHRHLCFLQSCRIAPVLHPLPTPYQTYFASLEGWLQ